MGICIGVCFVRVDNALGCREVFTYIDGKYCSIISYHIMSSAVEKKLDALYL